MGNDELEVSLPGRDHRLEADWYDYEAKYSSRRDGAGRARADRRRGDGSRAASSPPRAFKAIGDTGLARCDFFVRDDGEVLVNEINTIPGFTATSVFGKLFEASGSPYPELCDRLVQLALERYEARAPLRVLVSPSARTSRDLDHEAAVLAVGEVGDPDQVDTPTRTFASSVTTSSSSASLTVPIGDPHPARVSGGPSAAP